MPDEFTLRFGPHACTVVVGPGALATLGRVWQPAWREAVLVGDATVQQLFGEAVARQLDGRVARVLRLDFPPGEAHKTRATKERLEDAMLAQGVGRQACVVALGGGISLDLAGFVAATYLRGVPCVNVPTSLLAQVDASLGGKTGVNTPHGKNLVGAFHQPAAVLVDGEVLHTLPADEWANGLGEVVKHAVIADADLFAWIEAHAPDLRVPGTLDAYPLRRCLEIKAAVVQEDEREQGRRAILNFGHTVGHALEHALQHRIGHGRAVALGMDAEARLAAERCGLPDDDVDRVHRGLAALDLLSWPAGTSRPRFDELVPYLAVDKKRRDGTLRLALPCRLGAMAGASQGWTVEASLDQVRRAWEDAPCSA